MKLIFKFNLLVFSFFLFNTGYSQSVNKADLAKETTKMYYYSFSGVLNSDNIEALKSEISGMQFVTEVKIEYKAEKALGQVRLIAKEFYTNNDTDFEFNIYNLKMLLIRNNLMPSEYKFEIISK